MKADKEIVEAYIERMAKETRERFGGNNSSHWGAFKYGAAMTILADCLTVMSEQQKEHVIGPIKREQARHQ